MSKTIRAEFHVIITHLPSLHLLGGHHDDPGVLLEHHPPEVADGVLQAALRGDVALLRLGAVALRVLLRLRRGRMREKQKTVGWRRDGSHKARRHKHTLGVIVQRMNGKCACRLSFSLTVAAEFTMMILALM